MNLFPWVFADRQGFVMIALSVWGYPAGRRTRRTTRTEYPYKISTTRTRLAQAAPPLHCTTLTRSTTQRRAGAECGLPRLPQGWVPRTEGAGGAGQWPVE